MIIIVPLIYTKVRLAKQRADFEQTRITTCVILHESNSNPMECQNIEGQLLHDTCREGTSRRRALNSRLTSFFMWPIKIIVHVWSAWIGPPNLSASPEEEKMSAAFIGGRGSVTLYLCCHPVCQKERRCYRHTRESEKEKKERDKESRHRQGARLGLVCKHAPLTHPDRYSCREDNNALFFRYPYTEASCRKTIESNRAESDKTLLRSFLDFLHSTTEKSNQFIIILNINELSSKV